MRFRLLAGVPEAEAQRLLSVARRRRFDRGEVVFHRDVGDRRCRNYAVIYGQARITEGGAPELLQRLAYTYVGPGVTFPPMPDPPPGYITRIRIERVTGQGPWAGEH
jgi:hypothetical protein